MVSCEVADTTLAKHSGPVIQMAQGVKPATSHENKSGRDFICVSLRSIQAYERAHPRREALARSPQALFHSTMVYDLQTELLRMLERFLFTFDPRLEGNVIPIKQQRALKVFIQTHRWSEWSFGDSANTNIKSKAYIDLISLLDRAVQNSAASTD